MTSYDRLTALDASFLHMERLEHPMHVGAMSVLEGEPFFDANGHFRIGEVRDLVLSRLPLLPRFRRRLMNVPYDQGRPIWIDDANPGGPARSRTAAVGDLDGRGSRERSRGVAAEDAPLTYRRRVGRRRR